MKLLSKFIIIATFVLSSNIKIIAQEQKSVDKSLGGVQVDIPPLHVVMDSVLKRNPLVRFRSQDIDLKKEALKSEKIDWTKNFGVQATTVYGNFNNFSTNEDASSVTSAFATTSKQFNYQFGAYFKIPVLDVINRNKRIKFKKIQVSEAETMLAHEQSLVRQAVIEKYEDLILKQRLLKLKAENLGNGKVNMQMVEKEFRNGLVPVAEYVRLSDMTMRIESDYELALSKFLVAKKVLEDMAGFKFGITQLQ
ncbi:TolC family protein [Seonamhaeicola marinus]|uniref:TolC family protein n=1 Tax=Seonamhaeicola marinus TaxID=1912246 RepID=A0A5D0I450_9FLAO|nr:TolC family protein [Seonamhaeicola marinus]TYA78483.1 TolC family protein [Seonamhaeicola marinus]